MRESISIEETQRAVRLVYGIMAALMLCFLGLASCYHPDAMMVEYGRDSSHPWIAHKIRNLDMAQRRSHPTGKLVWLIGSSLVRESFDEVWINNQLAIQGADVRVVELGMDQGNSALAMGLMSQIDLQPGDVVVHNIALNAYRADWLDFTGLPAYQLMEVLEPEHFWSIPEWTLADKLEQASAVPYQFYAQHNSYTNGLTWWFIHLAEGELPSKRGPKHFLTHFKKEKQRFQAPDPSSRHYISATGLSFEGDQINRWGWSMMSKMADESDVRLVGVYLPPRQQYMAEMVHPNANQQFEEFMSHFPGDVMYFPQLPEEDYYDLTHPNFRGRTARSQTLLDWLNGSSMGVMPSITWPIPSYHSVQ